MSIKSYVGLASQYGTNAFTFEGISNISITCLNATNTIILHAKDLVFHEAKLHSLDANSSILSVDDKRDYDEERDFLILNINSKCEPNKNYKLELAYRGSIAETLYGFYRSSYADSHGNIH